MIAVGLFQCQTDALCLCALGELVQSSFEKALAFQRGRNLRRRFFQSIDAAEHDRAMDCVLKFPHVAGPRVNQELALYFGRETDSAGLFGIKPAKKMAGERKDVLRTLAQRRYPKVDHVQAEEKIFTESACRPFLAQ